MGWGYSGRGKTGAHEKSMHAYAQHAWSDAMAIAGLLDDEIGAVKARALYQQVAEANVQAFEREVQDQIEDFIKRTESQRPSVLRKLPNETTKATFLILAILGCLRAKAVIDLRDSYRFAMAPGSGYRDTTSAIYAFSNELRAVYEYGWPSELFDAVGIDDLGDFEDDDDEPVEPATEQAVGGGPLVAPAPPPPPEKDTDPVSELVLFAGEMASHVISADGSIVPKTDHVVGKPLWRVVASNYPHAKTFFRLFTQKPDPRDLVKPLVDLVNGFQDPGRRTILVASPSAKQIGDTFQSLVKSARPVMYDAKPGAAKRTFSKWLDVYLNDLTAEFALIDESAPTIAELNSLMPQVHGWSCIEFSEPDEKRDHRRLMTEGVIRRICCSRQRWPESMATLDRNAPARSFPDQAPKGVQHELKKFEAKNLNSYGQFLAKLARAAVDWRSSPVDPSRHEGQIGDSILDFMIRNPYQVREPSSLYSELADLIPARTIEADFIERCVLRRLTRPITANPKLLRREHWFQTGGTYAPAVAWWFTVSVDETPGRGALRCVPGATKAANAVRDALSQDCQLLALDLHPNFHGPVPTSEESPWTSKYSDRWHTPARELIAAFLGSRTPYAKKEWVKPDAKAGEYRVLVAMTFKDVESISTLAKHWAKAASAFQESMNNTLQQAEMPERVKVSKVPQEFLDPYIAASPRIAMLVGRMPGTVAR